MLTVSNYHYIRPKFKSNFPSIYGVTPDEFKKQLLSLKKEHEFISSNDLIDNLDLILKSKTNYSFVTFDDGLKEQYQYALPILEELNIKAVFFANSRNYRDKKLSTVHKIHLLRSIISPNEFINKLSNFSEIIISETDVDKAKSCYRYDDKEAAVIKYILNFKMDFNTQEEILKNIFNDFFEEDKVIEELYMSEIEIIHLAKHASLGSHTHNHYPIGLLKPNEIESELELSKRYFEDLTHTKIDMVAYPYGSPEACTKEVAEIAQKVGYKMGFTTTRGVNTEKTNTLLLNRFDCNDLLGGKNYKL